jgi:hypothetical protein
MVERKKVVVFGVMDTIAPSGELPRLADGMFERVDSIPSRPRIKCRLGRPYFILTSSCCERFPEELLDPKFAVCTVPHRTSLTVSPFSTDSSTLHLIFTLLRPSDMKLSEKLEQARGPFYTFEFFPPRTEQVSQTHRNSIG